MIDETIDVRGTIVLPMHVIDAGAPESRNININRGLEKVVVVDARGIYSAGRVEVGSVLIADGKTEENSLQEPLARIDDKVCRCKILIREDR
jgi:hypothetical protein